MTTNGIDLNRDGTYFSNLWWVLGCWMTFFPRVMTHREFEALGMTPVQG